MSKTKPICCDVCGRDTLLMRVEVDVGIRSRSVDFGKVYFVICLRCILDTHGAIDATVRAKPLVALSGDDIDETDDGVVSEALGVRMSVQDFIDKIKAAQT